MLKIGYLWIVVQVHMFSFDPVSHRDEAKSTYYYQPQTISDNYIIVREPGSKKGINSGAHAYL